jgi:hypothetical protein
MFVTRRLAKRAARELHDRTLRPFGCRCGYFHIGHLYGQTRQWHRQIHGEA